ncbi:MAG: hypothetical protein NTZ56_24285 [Acidobacteria bacterium]|nr:hypothetical protein [Acidobacteriota bacterium]
MLFEFGNFVKLTRKEEQRLQSDLSFMTPQQRREVLAEINHRLDELIAHPSPNWGPITNTSIEGGKVNELTGNAGDWTGTPLEHIYESCNRNVEEAGMMFGRLFKKIVIDRPEEWVGYRSDEENPTFPRRGINLQGKTYFLGQRDREVAGNDGY